jgi:hypothetical protein
MYDKMLMMQTGVARQNLSAPVNDKPLLRMVNVKRIGYGIKTTSPHEARVSFNHDVLR